MIISQEITNTKHLYILYIFCLQKICLHSLKNMIHRFSHSLYIHINTYIKNLIICNYWTTYGESSEEIKVIFRDVGKKIET